MVRSRQKGTAVYVCTPCTRTYYSRAIDGFGACGEHKISLLFRCKVKKRRRKRGKRERKQLEISAATANCVEKKKTRHYIRVHKAVVVLVATYHTKFRVKICASCKLAYGKCSLLVCYGIRSIELTNQEICYRKKGCFALRYTIHDQV